VTNELNEGINKNPIATSNLASLAIPVIELAAEYETLSEVSPWNCLSTASTSGLWRYRYIACIIIIIIISDGVKETSLKAKAKAKDSTI